MSIHFILEQLAQLLVQFISSNSYWAIFILMTLESCLIPIPSEVTMPFAGFMVGLGKLNFFWAVFLGALGNLFGSLLAYGLGYWGQENFVRNLVKKYGKFLLITYDEIETAERWFANHGEIISFGSRLLPVVRTFISLPAGFSQMNVIKFSIYTFLGAAIWSTLLAYFGFILGDNWNILGDYFRKFDIFFVGIVVFFGVLYIWYKVKKIKKHS